MFKPTGFLFSVLCTLATVQTAQAATAADLPKFLPVEKGLFRSARPTEAGYVELKNHYGVRTVIDLEDDSKAVAIEKKWADQQGIRFYSFPMSSWKTPNDAKVEQILDLMNDPNLQPVLVHCKHGEDRTGMMIGLHRVFEQGWPSKVAYKEMRALGFHKLLFVLDSYYKEKTNYYNKASDQDQDTQQIAREN